MGNIKHPTLPPVIFIIILMDQCILLVPLHMLDAEEYGMANNSKDVMLKDNWVNKMTTVCSCII
jgi:hypothetical protein